MVLVKILGGIDMLSALTLLLIIFGIHPPLALILFCSGLLFLKGLFILNGNVLSAVDLFSSAILLLSLLFTLSTILVWIPAFLLIAKGIVSFL